MIPTIDKKIIQPRTFGCMTTSGKNGKAKRTNPYVPIFRRTPARITEPAVGASTWASGNQVWNGNIGTLMAKAKKNARNRRIAKVEPYAGSWKMSGAVLYKAWMLKVYCPV